MKKCFNFTSASQITKFLGCPLAYKYSYLDGLEKPPKNKYLVYGIALHEALALNFSQKIKSKKDLKADEVINEFKLSFVKNLQLEELDGMAPLEVETFKQQGESSLKYYMKNISPDIQPIMVEERVEIKLKHFPITIVCVFDIVDENGIIIDFKSSGPSWKSDYTDKKMSGSIQLSLYAAAYRKMFGKVEAGLQFHILPRGEKDGECYVKNTIRTNDQVLYVLGLASKIEQVIERGVFTPNVNECGRCEWANTCPRLPFVETI